MRNRNIVIGIFIAVVILLLAAGLWAALSGSFYGHSPRMMWGWGYPMMGGGIMMFLIGLPLLVGTGVLVWYLSSSASRGVSGPGREESSLEILKRRYARGEIDREEYERMRREIE